MSICVQFQLKTGPTSRPNSAGRRVAFPGWWTFIFQVGTTFISCWGYFHFTLEAFSFHVRNIFISCSKYFHFVFEVFSFRVRIFFISCWGILYFTLGLSLISSAHYPVKKPSPTPRRGVRPIWLSSLLGALAIALRVPPKFDSKISGAISGRKVAGQTSIFPAKSDFT